MNQTRDRALDGCNHGDGGGGGGGTGHLFSSY